LRSKLACDIHNHLGLPSISANFIKLYINDEYIGFYILMDAIKLSWVEFVYGERKTSYLYKCEELAYGLSAKSARGCINDNEEVNDHTEWINFLTSLDKAQSVADIEKVLDVDLFLKEIALEYLFGSWDHYPQSDHNFNFYKGNDNKWKYLIYDFDAEFGQDLNNHTTYTIAMDQDTPINYELFKRTKFENNYNYPQYSFIDWLGSSKSHIIDILILKNPTRFIEILKEIVENTFNPDILFPHIDKLKSFIKNFVEQDKSPNKNGQYPGQFDESVGLYSLAQWDANCEFTSIHNFIFNTEAYGLKYWILEKYKYICHSLKMNCNTTYLDHFEYSINREPKNDFINPKESHLDTKDTNTKRWNDDL